MNAFGMKRNKSDKGIKEKAKSKRNNSIKDNSYKSNNIKKKLFELTKRSCGTRKSAGPAELYVMCKENKHEIQMHV
jgi:hypothetical protein